MLKLTNKQLDWLLARIPVSEPNPKGGRPEADRRRTLQGIFWILDNGAKWKDLPRRFGAKSTVHRWFKIWTEAGVFETILHEAGQCVDERDGYRVYECFIDGSFAKAKGGGDGIGCTKAGKGVKIMVLVDARGLPLSVETLPAHPHESRLVQHLFDFMLTDQMPERVIGDKAYDSDALDAELAKKGVERIAPHRRNRSPEKITQDGRAATLQAPLDRGANHCLDSEFPPALHSLGTIDHAVPGIPSSRMHVSTAQSGFGIACIAAPGM